MNLSMSSRCSNNILGLAPEGVTGVPRRPKWGVWIISHETPPLGCAEGVRAAARLEWTLV